MREDIEEVLAALGRRPTHAELGQLVAETFADRRAEARSVIGEQLRRMTEGGEEEAEEALPLLDDRAGPVSVRGRSISQRREIPGASESTGEGVAREARERGASKASGEGEARAAAVDAPLERPARRGAAAAALIGAAVVGAGLVAALQGLVDRPSPVATAATSAQPPPGPEVALQAPQRALIQLRIGAAPADATIYLDDVEVPSNPFAAKFPRDGTGHRIRVEADGYAPEARLVVFDGDIALDFTLSPATTAAVSRALAGAVSPGRTAAPQGTGAASGRGVEAGAPASASAPPAGSVPKVDSSDPWKRRPR
jgi:serine/threonine-protein kinase